MKKIIIIFALIFAVNIPFFMLSMVTIMTAKTVTAMEICLRLKKAAGKNMKIKIII